MKNTKLFLEIYGIVRMIFGAGEIVGLSAGYFLTETILNYPKDYLLLFDQEIVALMYLAVILRGIFHVISGIGIARLKLWARILLLWGWPIMMMVTMGVVHSLYSSWSSSSALSAPINIFDILLWPFLILYLALIGFDLFFVTKSIHKLNEDPDILKENGGTIEGKKVALVLFIAIFSFCVIIFLGRPIRGGFHQGFYKTSGQVSPKGKKTKVLTAGTSSSTSTETASDQLKKETTHSVPHMPEEFLGKPKIVSMAIEEHSQSLDPQDPTKIILSEKEAKLESGFPYRKVMGFAGGLCLIVAFLLQMMEMDGGKNNQISAISFALLSLGFFLWIFYGLGSKIVPIYLTSFISFVLCCSILLTRLKK